MRIHTTYISYTRRNKTEQLSCGKMLVNIYNSCQLANINAKSVFKKLKDMYM